METKDLTTSFGWTGHQVFQQHDVQELLRVLLEALEKTILRGQTNLPHETKLEGASIEQLFRGKQG